MAIKNLKGIANLYEIAQSQRRQFVERQYDCWAELAKKLPESAIQFSYAFLEKSDIHP